MPYVRPLSEANDDVIVRSFVKDVDVVLAPVAPSTVAEVDHELYVNLAEPDSEISAEAADTPIATRAVEARRILRMFVSNR